MKALKIFMVVVAVVLITGMVADTWAACFPARLFRSSGKFGTNVKVDASGTENGANVIGRLWDTADVGNSYSGDNGELCPPSIWWVDDGNGLNFVDGNQGEGACAPVGCPSRDMTVLVEDYDTNGFPGVDGTAYYIGFAVTETPASGRWYDYGLVDGITSATTLPMLEFPDAIILDSGRQDGNVAVDMELTDQGDRVHSWLNDGVAPTSAIVSEWHLMKATGTSDPGRARANWVQIDQVAYADGGVMPFPQVVACTDTVQDEYLAIGIGFNGGTSIVDSALVGRATILECDPNLAQPDDIKQEFKRKPANTELQPNPGRSGGRR